MSEPCCLFLWRRGRRSGPSLKYWGDAPVTSNHVRRGSSSVTSKRAGQSACWSLRVGGARGRGLIGAEAEPLWEAQQT